MFRAVILVADEFQDEEFIYPYYRMLEEGWTVDVASISGRNVNGKYGITAQVNHRIAMLLADYYDLVVIPGGWSPEKLRMDADVLDFVRKMHGNRKLIAAICHGPQVLISASLVRGRKVTGYRGIMDDLINAGALYPAFDTAWNDGNLITAQHYRDLPAFMREIIEYMRTVHKAEDYARAGTVTL